jgi:hypothetical protein
MDAFHTTRKVDIIFSLSFAGIVQCFVFAYMFEENNVSVSTMIIHYGNLNAKYVQANQNIITIYVHLS